MKIEKLNEQKFIKAKWANLNKRNTIDAYFYEVYGNSDFSVKKMLVEEIVTLTYAEWCDFRKGLLVDREWLEGKGGTNSTYKLSPEREKEVKALWQMTEEERKQWQANSYRTGLLVQCENSHQCVAVDPQGYSYARYVGIDVEFIED